MIGAVLVALALAAPPPNVELQDTDTTFAAAGATSLAVDAVNGRVTVQAWDRPEIRVRSSADGAGRMQIRRRGSTVRVDAGGRFGMRGPIEIQVNVPRKFSLSVEGVALPVSVEGLEGAVEVENVEGAIVVSNVTGRVTAGSASAPVRLDNIRGDVEASSVNQSIDLHNVRGRITASAVNGSITVRNADSNHSDVSTVNGYVDYQGTIRDGGSYRLSTHNGRITLAVPPDANARMSITARQGKVEAGFPVPVGTIRDRSASFTLGSGSARVDVETFNGTIHLVRPGGR